jgi:hypothetical protein
MLQSSPCLFRDSLTSVRDLKGRSSEAEEGHVDRLILVVPRYPI